MPRILWKHLLSLIFFKDYSITGNLNATKLAYVEWFSHSEISGSFENLYCTTVPVLYLVRHLTCTTRYCTSTTVQYQYLVLTIDVVRASHALLFEPDVIVHTQHTYQVAMFSIAVPVQIQLPGTRYRHRYLVGTGTCTWYYQYQVLVTGNVPGTSTIVRRTVPVLPSACQMK
jgi:hypothetical protein